MANGYSHHEEVEKLFAAVVSLSSPGEVLHGRVQVALGRYRNLSRAEQCFAADRLKYHLSGAVANWAAGMEPPTEGGE